MSTILRQGKITNRKGTCQDCWEAFSDLQVAKRHSDRLGHVIHWDVTYRRTIKPEARP
jgi:hypothetical protein